MYRFKRHKALFAIGLAPLLLAAAAQIPQSPSPSAASFSGFSLECQSAAVHAVVQLANANPALRATAAFPRHAGFGVAANPAAAGLLVSVIDLSGERAGQSLYRVSLDAACRPTALVPLAHDF